MTRSLKITPNSNRSCLSCGLFLNQLPLKDNKAHADVFWVGLSAVKQEEGDSNLPLSSTTRTGGLISDVESQCSDDLMFYKTNAVKCLPLKASKIRYPSRSEMKDCFPNLEMELDVLKPKIVFLLGKQVGAFIMSQLGIKNIEFDKAFNYSPMLINGVLYVPIHHPSYMLVYKRRFIDDYINSITSIINQVFKKKRKAA